MCEVMSNSLVISGPPEAVKEVQALVDSLDQPPGLLLLEMEIGEIPLGEAKHGEKLASSEKPSATTAESFRLLERPAKMEIVARARLLTLDNQPAFAQLGSRVPSITSVNNNAVKGLTHSVNEIPVGLILQMTPRINADGVVMQIDVEQSQLGPESEGVPISVAGDKVVRSPQVEMTTIQTTVSIPNAQTIILGSVARHAKSDKETVIVLTPHILGLEEAKKVR